jgi:hypothetical protein
MNYPVKGIAKAEWPVRVKAYSNKLGPIQKVEPHYLNKQIIRSLHFVKSLILRHTNARIIFAIVLKGCQEILASPRTGGTDRHDYKRAECLDAD